MSNKLFEEFNPVSEAEWKQKIQFDLKGADYNETLLWHTNEGITVKPFYHSEQLKSVTTITSENAFSICETIEVTDAKSGNNLATNALNNGAESIKFNIYEPVAVSELLNEINEVDIHFNFSFLNTDYIQETIKILKSKSGTFYLNLDIIGNLAKSGNWFDTLANDHNALEQILKNDIENINVIGINVNLYQNAGANAVQQLAYAMAHLNEYLNHFGKKVISSLQFNMAVGSNYFFEIAKIRALRMLTNILFSAYDSENTEVSIFATPSKRNKTLYDYNVNMLRTTTECMSAILGGANTVGNMPYDYLYHNQNEFGDRISRNQLLVLKAESYFDKVKNPADGSYYIENITNQMAEKALEIFKLIEASGGFLAQLKDGTIQRKISESAKKEQEQFNNGDLILLGTNKHPNEADKMKHDLEKDPFPKKNPRKTLIAPIIEKRLSENLDKKRLENE